MLLSTKNKTKRNFKWIIIQKTYFPAEFPGWSVIICSIYIQIVILIFVGFLSQRFDIFPLTLHQVYIDQVNQGLSPVLIPLPLTRMLFSCSNEKPLLYYLSTLFHRAQLYTAPSRYWTYKFCITEFTDQHINPLEACSMRINKWKSSTEALDTSKL